LRKSPDEDWVPAFRKPSKVPTQEEIVKFLDDLKHREIAPSDYDKILSMDNKASLIPFHKFLALSYEKQRGLFEL